MNRSEHMYQASRVTHGQDYIPSNVREFLNGEDLLSKTQAIRLSTLNEKGWPHAALLSAGDVLLLASGDLRFVIFSESGTATNLARDDRLVMSMTCDGGMCELLMHASQYREAPEDIPLAFFAAKIERVRMHYAHYAELTSGINFRLYSPETVLKRWTRQIEALRDHP